MILTAVRAAKLKLQADREVLRGLSDARRTYSGALFCQSVCSAIDTVLMEAEFFDRYLTGSNSPTEEAAMMYLGNIISAVECLRLAVEAKREQWAQVLNPRQVITGVSGQSSLPL